MEGPENAKARRWPLPPGIAVLEPKNTSLTHTEVMVALLRCLREWGVSELNWAHVNPPIPRADLPLKVGGRPYDIVFRLRGRLVCLEVDVYSSYAYVKPG